MSEARNVRTSQRAAPAATSIEDTAVERAFAEPLSQILDFATWSTDAGLAELYHRLGDEVAAAVALEARLLPRVRGLLLPALQRRAETLPCAGVYPVSVERLAQVHRGLLFTGGVEAVDGSVQSHDTLPVTVTQIGIGLVSYRGDRGTWLQRLYRRDLRLHEENLEEAALALLEARHDRAAIDYESARDRLSELSRRGIMAYAERMILSEGSQAIWRLGHGQPAPVELLKGSGSLGFLRASLDLLRRLILGHQKFVFVPSAPADRRLLTLGGCLRPLEFAIVDTMEDAWLQIVEGGHNVSGGFYDLAAEFAHEVGPRVVMGVYRAAAMAPPQVFYAHVDHACEAGVIALADSTLQEHRGFPLLLDIADAVCRANFGSEVFDAAAQSAYAVAGQPTRYLAERRTRYR